MVSESVSKMLSEKIIEYIDDRRDKKEENFLKDKPKKNEQGIVTNGGICTRLSAMIKGIYSEKLADISGVEKSKREKEQTALAFQQSRYEKLSSLVEENTVSNQIHDLKAEYHDFLIKNNVFFETVTWLTMYAAKAKDISFATHVGKLTHSSSKSSSILDVTEEKKSQYLTTNSLTELIIDTASANAASLPIADILKINVGNVSVLDCVKNGDFSLFKYITEDEVLINRWCEQLKQAYDSSEKQSYFLSKQTYFPVGDDAQYHLLLPLTSSSLVHDIHFKHKAYFDDEQTFARAQKKAKKYSSTLSCTYPNKAYLHVTGSNHSNASSLNGKRGGRIALLPMMPPQWQSKIPSYLDKETVFDRTLGYELKNDINDLRKYLCLIKNKSLSISEPKRNAAVISKLQQISDSFFNYVGKISNSETSGWTIDCRLLIEYQLLFEPWREDEAVSSMKKNNAWQDIISKQYGRWLNKQLNQKDKLLLNPIHEALWRDAFSIELREYTAIQEVKV